MIRDTGGPAYGSMPVQSTNDEDGDEDGTNDDANSHDSEASEEGLSNFRLKSSPAQSWNAALHQQRTSTVSTMTSATSPRTDHSTKNLPPPRRKANPSLDELSFRGRSPSISIAMRMVVHLQVAISMEDPKRMAVPKVEAVL